MAGVHFVFETRGFADDPARLAESVNGIAGHTLATWLANGLSAAGFDASAVWVEDHGWDFSVSHQGARYLCACSIEEDGAPPREAHVALQKMRSMADRLMGRNRYDPRDTVGAAVAGALAASPHVSGLSSEIIP
jgi:hypothetical protein